MSIFLLLLTTLIWGMAFIAARWTLDFFSPVWAHAIRFSLAGIVALPLLFRLDLKQLPFKEALKIAFGAAFFLTVHILLQTIGLKYTSVAKSGFITTFYAFFTPLIAMLFFRQRYRNGFWGLVVLALIGVALLCDLELKNFNFGDFITLVCAVFGAGHILYIDRFANHFKSPFAFNALQLFLCGIMGMITALVLEGVPDFSPLYRFENFWQGSAPLGFFITAVVSSVVAFSLQIYSQKQIEPHIVALIFLLESPFAAVFGYIFLGETLTVTNIIGCALVMVSVALLPKVMRKKSTPA